jgi:hypothetical protein
MNPDAHVCVQSTHCINLDSGGVLRLGQREKRELPYQTLISSLLHKYASGRLKEG